MNKNNPVIIHGSGRSGSSLLAGILRANQNFYMPDEISFIVPRLYKMLWENHKFLRNWLVNQQILKERKISWIEMITNKLQRDTEIQRNKKPEQRTDPLTESFRVDVQNRERRRIQALIKQMVVDVLAIDKDKYTHWGFKEIWNGAQPWDFNWNIYKEILGEPKWIHVVRNPFDQVASMAGNSGIENPSRIYIADRLRRWVFVNKRSLELETDLNYLCIRYEDLCNESEIWIAALCRHVEINYDPNMLIPLKWNFVPGKVPTRSIGNQRSIAEEVEDLEPLMSKFEYSLLN